MQDTSTYNPDSVEQFSKKALNFNGQGIMGSALPGASTNFDYLLLDDHLITGVEYIIQSAVFGDFLTLQIVASDTRFGVPAGTVLNQFATNWYVSSNSADELRVPYPAKLSAGMIIRFIYTSVGSVAVNVAVNLEIHKILI